MHDVTLYLSYAMMPGRRRCPQVRGPDKGGSTVILYMYIPISQKLPSRHVTHTVHVYM